MSCLFCALPNHTNILADFPEETIIEKTANFYAKPALGHFIEGYVLIFSNQHLNSFSSLSQENLSELASLKKRIREKLENLYNCPTLCFEHGLVDYNYKAGCCIDHAHCHIVPVAVDISDELKKLFPYNTIEFIEELAHIERPSSYISFEANQDSSINVFSIKQPLPSQFVRRLIGYNLGLMNEWDWRRYPYRESIKFFLKKYIANHAEQ